MLRRLSQRVLVSLVLAMVAVAAGASEELEARIAAAEHLNVTAPWQESQAAIDDLASELGKATPDQRARVRFLEARNFALAGDYAAAVAVAKQLGDVELDAEIRLKAFRLLANIELQRDRFEPAYGYLRSAIALIPEVDAAEPITNLLALAAYFFGAAGDGERAIDYGRQALEVASSADRPRARCIAFHDLAVAYQEADRPEAIPTRRMALGTCEAAGDPVHLGLSRVSLGYLLHRETPSEAAVAMIRRGLEEVEETGYRDGIMLARVRLAQVLADTGDPDEAEALLQPMIDDLEQLEFWRNLERAHSVLALTTSGRGEFEQSIRHLQAARAADEKLMDRDRSRRVAYLQAEFDIRSKEQQIALLRERNAVLRLEEETQEQRRVLALGGAAALAIIVVLLLGLLARTMASRRRLLWLSEHDGLTALFNHTAFFEHADAALRQCRRANEPFMLVLADIDLFKSVNDVHGHAIGDGVLREVGQLLRETFGDAGIVGRIGGEEFGIALPGLRRQATVMLIEGFNGRLVTSAGRGDRPRVTLSFGVAVAAADESLEQMRQRADLALYQAKRTGRNRIVDAPEGIDLPTANPARA